MTCSVYVCFLTFFILRVNELKRVRYPFISANVQNFVILYIFAWLYMYPWFKYIIRKQMDSSFYSFNLQFRRNALRTFFKDIDMHGKGLINYISTSKDSEIYNYITFYYWYESSALTTFSGFRKSGLISSFRQTIIDSVLI